MNWREVVFIVYALGTSLRSKQIKSTFKLVVARHAADSTSLLTGQAGCGPRTGSERYVALPQGPHIVNAALADARAQSSAALW